MLPVLGRVGERGGGDDGQTEGCGRRSVGGCEGGRSWSIYLDERGMLPKKTIVGIKRLLYSGWICYTKEKCQISIMLEVTAFELL